MQDKSIAKLVLIIMGVLLLISICANFYLVNYTRTLLVTADGHDRIEFTGSEAPEKYLTRMAEHVIALGFTYSEVSARRQFTQLLSFYHPSDYEAQKDRLYYNANKIEGEHLASVFFVQDIKPNPGAKEIRVIGILRQTKEDKTIYSDMKKLLIKYDMRAGRFTVISIVDERAS